MGANLRRIEAVTSFDALAYMNRVEAELKEAGFDAGAVIKAISGNIKGGGGGKAAMAQAGGKDASGIDAALQAARDMLL